MRYMLLGEAPTTATEDRPELWLRPDRSGMPHTANRLLRFTGWSLDRYMGIFVRRDNLLTRAVDDRWGRGDTARARARCKELVREARESGSCIVALGVRVARMVAAELGHKRPIEPLMFLASDDPTSVKLMWHIPHPSGRNLWWNDANNVRSARLVFDDIRRTAS